MKRGGKMVRTYGLYLVLILCISFFLPRFLPGSPLSVLDEATASQNMEAFPDTFREYYAPEKPEAVQFLLYLKHLLCGDLGYSLTGKRKVADMIGESLGYSLLLAGLAMTVSTWIGVWYGMRAGLKEGSSPVRLFPLILLQAVPVFLLAESLRLLFSYRLSWFPPRGAYSVGMHPSSEGFLLDVLYHMVLPLTVMILSEIPGIAVFTYNSTVRIKKQQFVRMAVYLNLTQNIIEKKYIFRNILPEILGKLSIQSISCVAGTMFVEAVFAYPGIGMLLRTATANRDYPLMQGVLLTVCTLALVINAIFEFLIQQISRR